MANQQVRDVLTEVAGFHHRLAGLYRRTADQSSRERMRMLLYYLSRHEDHLAEALSGFEASGRQAVLDHWLPLKTVEHLLADLKRIELPPQLGTEELVERALYFDNLVITFYRTLAEQIPDEPVRQLFLTLLRLEQREEKALSRDTIETGDT
jgi:rubrerythrin